MSDVINITSSSSEDEEVLEEPPHKRIKPTSVLRAALDKQDNKPKVIRINSNANNILGNKHVNSIPNSLTVIKIPNNTKETNNNGPVSGSNQVIVIDDDVMSCPSSPKSPERVQSSDSQDTIILDESNSVLQENKEATTDEPKPSNKDEDFKAETTSDCPLSPKANDFIPESPLEQDTDELFTVHSVPVEPSSSSIRIPEAGVLLDNFLEVCQSSVRGSQFENKLVPIFDKLRTRFQQCSDIHSTNDLKKLILECTTKAQVSPAAAVISFEKLISYCKDNVNGEKMEVDPKKLEKLRMIEKAMRKIKKAIIKLDDMEMDLDDLNSETSPHIIRDRYVRKLVQLHNKHCAVLGVSNATVSEDHRIVYSSSKHVEINKAVSKTFKKNSFPSYYNIQQCIKKCVAKADLKLTTFEINRESQACFEKIGNMLQSERKRELFNNHRAYIDNSEDPAKNEQELENQLRKNNQAGSLKMRQVLQKFADLQQEGKCQEEGEGKVSSPDSDDSQHESSSSEDNDK